MRDSGIIRDDLPTQAERPPDDRAFKLLWYGQTVSALGTTVSRLALPLAAIVVLHSTTFQVSLLTAAAWIPWLLFGLPVGAWVDRLPRRSILLVCDLASAVLFASIPLAAALGVLSFEQMVVVALLAGFLSVFFQTAYHVYLADVVTQELLLNANAKLQGSEAVAQVAGPSLAGLIASLIGATAGVLLDALTFVFSFVLTRRISDLGRPTTDATGKGVPLRRQIAVGVHFVASDPYLRVLTIYGSLTNLALIGYQSIVVTFLVRTVRLGPALVGVVLAAASVGGVLGAVLAQRVARSVGTSRALIFSALCTAPFGLLAALAGGGFRLVLPMLGVFVVAAGIVCSNVVKDSFRQTYCPPEMLGRVLVTMQFLNYGSIPLGAVLAGGVATVLGLRTAVALAMGVLLLAALTLLLGPLRHTRDLPTRSAAFGVSP